MKKIIFLILFLPVFCFSQQRSGNVWAEVGIKGKFSKKAEWGVEVNNRFGGGRGIVTFFPQVSFKYKITKWFKPSIDYRFILEKDKYTNYQPANRFMLNASFDTDLGKRIKASVRLRYQYEFSRWNRNSGYEQELSQAIRLKPELNFDLKKSAFSPYINGEIFYGLTYDRNYFYKYRLGVGTDLELDDPLEISIGYILDHELFDKNENPTVRHIVSVSFKYKL